MCTTCKKSGHTAETCFQNIGYPYWWGERSKQSTRGGRGGGRGRGGMVRANAVVVHGSNNVSVEAERNRYTWLCNEQWNTLIKILEEKKSSAPRLSGPYNEEPEWSRGT